MSNKRMREGTEKERREGEREGDGGREGGREWRVMRESEKGVERVSERE